MGGHHSTFTGISSGTAVYRQDFTVNHLPDGRVTLDLVRVDVVAAVYRNGARCGTLWKTPYALDITGQLRKGQNQLVIRVANLWVNRLIAGADFPPGERISWETFNPYKPGDKPMASGLLGRSPYDPIPARFYGYCRFTPALPHAGSGRPGNAQVVFSSLFTSMTTSFSSGKYPNS